MRVVYYAIATFWAFGLCASDACGLWELNYGPMGANIESLRFELSFLYSGIVAIPVVIFKCISDFKKWKAQKKPRSNLALYSSCGYLLFYAVLLVVCLNEPPDFVRTPLQNPQTRGYLVNFVMAFQALYGLILFAINFTLARQSLRKKTTATDEHTTLSVG